MQTEIDEHRLLGIVRLATDRPDAAIAACEVTPASHEVENMTTHALDHVVGTLHDGTRWQLFAKTLHPASASPLFAHVPEEHHQRLLAELCWQDEPRVYRSRLAQDLPPGLRLPEVWAIDEGPDRLVLWLEHVDDHGPWDAERYRRSARVLGRLAGRWPEARVEAELGLGRRTLRYLFAGKISNFDLPVLADDATWADPALAGLDGPGMRAGLEQLAASVPTLLDRLDTLPHALAHGDASPANLLEPGDATVVAVDWSYGSIGPVGSDLAQLVAGRFESGLAEVDELPGIVETVVDGYVAGLADEGVTIGGAELELAWATNLVVRSAFSALLVEPRPGLSDEARADLVRRRSALVPLAVELAERVTAA